MSNKSTYLSFKTLRVFSKGSLEELLRQHSQRQKVDGNPHRYLGLSESDVCPGLLPQAGQEVVKWGGSLC